MKTYNFSQEGFIEAKNQERYIIGKLAAATAALILIALLTGINASIINPAYNPAGLAKVAFKLMESQI